MTRQNARTLQDAREHLRARRVVEALRHFEQCDFDECAGDVWCCHMLSGDFESAWRTSDEIERRSPSRVWNGEWFNRKRVLIRCVHGLGDTIQLIRYARELKRAGAVEVTAQMHPELTELISTAPGLDAAITWGPRPEFDIEIEITELAWTFRTCASNVPAEVPYLDAPPGRIAQRAQRFANSTGMRVGLIWTSSQWDTTRSIPLAMVGQALRDIPDVTYFSVQHGPGHVQAAQCDWVRYEGEQSSDILDTAADLMNIDLLIAVDTMAAHLAGALARPVWLLLKHDADWRWMLGRCDSPWYPTMRLFRQPRPGDWETPLGAMARRLEAVSPDRCPAASSRTPDLLWLF